MGLMEDNSNKLDGRVSHLETEVASVKTEVANVGKNVDVIINSLSELRRNIGSYTQTNWGVIFGGIVALLAILGFIGNIIMTNYSSDVSRIEQRQVKLEDRLYEELIKERDRLVIKNEKLK